MDLMKGAFLFASFFVFCVFLVEAVQWYVSDRNTVRKVVKLFSNKCLFSYLNYMSFRGAA